MHQNLLPWYTGPKANDVKKIFLAVLLITLLASIQDYARAQQSRKAKIPRVGILGRRGNPGLEAFRQELREFGYMEGQNIAVEYSAMYADETRLADYAAALLRTKPDIIVVTTVRGSVAAKQLTASIPIITTVISDAFESGVVNSLNRPGGNVTGLSLMAPALGEKTAGAKGAHVGGQGR